MNAATAAIGDYCADVVRQWNRFWFQPVDPATFCAVRLCAGLMLFYTHLVWTFDLEAFFGPDGWLPLELRETAQAGTHMWSIFWYIESPGVLWTVHIFALTVFAAFAVGLFSRVSSVLAYLFAINYAMRVVPGAFFGLDKINCMLAMYLMLGPSGACYSVDRWWKARRTVGPPPPVEPSIGANVGLRMIQLHMCVIYLFSGLCKLQGYSWWDGSAMWMSLANYEYQSLDLTWLAPYRRVMELATHLVVFWEVFYIALVWQSRWRPIVLFGAILVHGGIAISMGMITFGLAMLIGNMAFLSPSFVRAIFDPLAGRCGTGTCTS